VKGIRVDADPTDAFAHIVIRYCLSVNANDEDCKKYKDLLLDSLRCKAEGSKDVNGDVFTRVRCCYAPEPPTVGRRLLDGETLLTSASGDEGAAEGLTFAAEENSASVAKGAMGMMIVLAFLN
jgi:hypothetical protein